MPSQTLTKRIKKSLRYSMLDGAFYSLKTGLADSFFSPLAILLRATNLQLGLLGSLPLAVSSTFQLLSKQLIRLFKSRLRLIYVMGWLHCLSLIAIVALLIAGKLTVNLMLLFIVLYWVFDRMGVPAWNSLMGDLVHENDRGKYFSRRNRIVQLTSFIGVVVGGTILAFFESSYRIRGFITIFALAVGARFVSLYYLRKMYEPPNLEHARPGSSLLGFLRRALHTSLGNFILYYVTVMLAVYMVAPFYAAYLINDIGIKYWHYTLIVGASVLIKFITLPLWGFASDRYGSRKVLVLSGLIMPLVPVLIILRKELWFLVVANSFAGFVWGGFDLAAFNYLLDSTTPLNRATCAMYNNFLTGIGMLLGSMAGVLIAKHNTFYWSSYVLVFIVSGVIRLFAVAFFAPRIKEIRKVEHIKYHNLFFDVLTIGPIMGGMLKVIAFNEKHLKKLVKRRR